MSFDVNETRCGECTLCCDLFPVKWLNKPANTKCIHCNLGCKIHDTKEDECKNFECAYLQFKTAHIDLRPDNCKMIFEKVSDEIFYGLQHPDFEFTDVAKRQVYSFLQQGFSVILKSTKHKELVYHINPKHNKDKIIEEFNKIIKEKYGNSRLYN